MNFSNIFSFRVRLYHFSLIEEVYDHLLLVRYAPHYSHEEPKFDCSKADFVLFSNSLHRRSRAGVLDGLMHIPWTSF